MIRFGNPFVFVFDTLVGDAVTINGIRYCHIIFLVRIEIITKRTMWFR